jgi:hypothetical protein
MRTFIIEIEGKEVTIEIRGKYALRRLKCQYWYLLKDNYTIYEVFQSKMNAGDFTLSEDIISCYSRYVRSYRIARKVTIQQVVEETGILPKRYYQYENGHLKLTRVMMQRIVNAITRILDRQESTQTTSVVSTYQKTKRA